MSLFPQAQLNAAQQWIVHSAHGGTLPHSLLLWGQGDLRTIAQFAAAAYQCEGTPRPCGKCNPCQKMENGIHPDVMVVEDSAHKMIAVDVVRQLRQSAFVMPNEGQRKVYIFPDASLLTPQDQNVLLKLVEEGPRYCAFVFCVENASQVLQTLRSRCVSLYAGQDDVAQVPPCDMGVALCQALLGKKGAITTWAVKAEGQKPSRQELEQILQDGRQLCIQALAAVQTQRSASNPVAQAMAQGLGAQRLSKHIHTLQLYYNQCAYNIGVSHTLGALAIELEENP
ncbi:DNA polymerase III subunit delta' [Bengtsoniella intestinalis]|uniref:DNA polymerase III subunit delta' n=1 Tax=Bengtsoniella intestinalis TaxID=3073143 RepID=UPI00391FA428